jgi:hypothetical protein
MQWFDVDKAGLAKLLSRKGKEFIVFELVQNAWDEKANEVRVTLERVVRTKNAQLTVEDDNPEGFVDLSHAFTLFAESTKKADTGKRGRFNLGEKLVLALCDEAEISSTKGTIQFDKQGRHARRLKRDRGSMFTGVLRITQEEIDNCGAAIHRLLPPSNVTTWYNGTVLPSRSPIRTIEATLPTEIADAEGYLRKTTRKTTIEIYEPLPGETAMVYEMGIPVVETGDRWHVNVLQKVPLTVDRDNVPPSYLALIRLAVVNATQDQLTSEDANSTWVKDAIQQHSSSISEETVGKLTDLRFGLKRVAYDPSDPESNKLAVSKGYTVVYGSQMSKPEWDAVKRANAILPAGQVTPSPKPFSPDGKPLNVVPREKWTAGMKAVAAYVQRIAPKLIGAPVSVEIANDVTWPFCGTYGKGALILNAGRLGHGWFSEKLDNIAEINQLIIHELGHHYSGDHLSSDYHDGLCVLGAKLTQLALSEPSLFKERTTACSSISNV